MADNKKEVERTELHRTIWAIADEILPPMSRFGGGGNRQEKKKNVIEKIQTFFERYFGL